MLLNLHLKKNKTPTIPTNSPTNTPYLPTRNSHLIYLDQLMTSSFKINSQKPVYRTFNYGDKGFNYDYIIHEIFNIIKHWNIKQISNDDDLDKINFPTKYKKINIPIFILVANGSGKTTWLNNNISPILDIDVPLIYKLLNPEGTIERSFVNTIIKSKYVEKLILDIFFKTRNSIYLGSIDNLNLLNKLHKFGINCKCVIIDKNIVKNQWLSRNHGKLSWSDRNYNNILNFSKKLDHKDIFSSFDEINRQLEKDVYYKTPTVGSIDFNPYVQNNIISINDFYNNNTKALYHFNANNDIRKLPKINNKPNNIIICLPNKKFLGNTNNIKSNNNIRFTTKELYTILDCIKTYKLKFNVIEKFNTNNFRLFKLSLKK